MTERYEKIRKVLTECRDIAMEWTLRGRIPECGKFGEIAQDLDAVCAEIAAQQRPVEDGCHCGTCTCNPNMTPAVRFDLSPAQTEGAIREHLIRLGWTPPDERAMSQQPAAVDAGLAQRIQALVGGVEVDLEDPLREQEE